MQKLLNQKLVDNSVDEESDDDDASIASGSKKIKKKVFAATPVPVVVATSSISPGAASNISPKSKIPQNPLLKKKLLNLQRFLAEFTVHFFDTNREFGVFYDCDFFLGWRPPTHGLVHGETIEEAVSGLL